MTHACDHDWYRTGEARMTANPQWVELCRHCDSHRFTQDAVSACPRTFSIVTNPDGVEHWLASCELPVGHGGKHRGRYFNPGYTEDEWLAEWDEDQIRQTQEAKAYFAAFNSGRLNRAG